jgi:hypothetical protein
MKLKPRWFFWLMTLILLVCTLPGGSAGAVVDLLYFHATPGTVSIMLSWETATEFDNIGFYVQRSLTGSGPFTRVSSLILSYGDPLTGHNYTYEDVAVSIGVQYYYILEILNADNTSSFTAPVAVIIPAPTATPTLTPTRTLTPVVTPTLTLTSTPTGQATATKTPVSVLPTYTLTFTPSPTTTPTHTPTTTLEPVIISNLVFPAFSPTVDKITETVDAISSAAEINIIHDTEPPVSETQNQPLIITLVILWMVLGLFLFLGVRTVKRDGKQS